MIPDQEAGHAVADVIADIRITTIVDLISLVAACRELVRTLNENDAVELLMPEGHKRQAFYKQMRIAKVALWRAMRQVEKKPEVKKP